MANNGTLAFHRLSVSVDVIFLSAFDEALWTLLRRRRESPFRGRYAIPGGFLPAFIREIPSLASSTETFESTTVAPLTICCASTRIWPF